MSGQSVLRLGAVVALLAVAACKPPATDEYSERSRIAPQAKGPSKPIVSPDTEGAIWAEAARENRLLYGKPGEAPLMALECVMQGNLPLVTYTRFAKADPYAKAILALIGNGHVARLMIDAKEVGDAWLWQGTLAADDPQLDVLTGVREVEATVPGAGSVILNGSPLPATLVETCRAMAPGFDPEEAEQEPT